VLLLAAMALAGGLYLQLPRVLPTIHQTPTWQLPLYWAFEISAVAGFFVAMLFLIFGITDRRDQLTRSEINRNSGTMFFWNRLLILFAIGLVMDLAMTMLGFFSDESARQNAVVGQASFDRAYIYSEEKNAFGDSIAFRALVQCRVCDANNQWHRTWIQAHSGYFPEEAKKAILARQLPVTCEVLYDPEFPSRFWGRDIEDSGNRSTDLSMGLTLFSVIVAVPLYGLFFLLLLAVTKLPKRICEMVPFFALVTALYLTAWSRIHSGLQPLWPFESL